MPGTGFASSSNAKGPDPKVEGSDGTVDNPARSTWELGERSWTGFFAPLDLNAEMDPESAQVFGGSKRIVWRDWKRFTHGTFGFRRFRPCFAYGLLLFFGVTPEHASSTRLHSPARNQVLPKALLLEPRGVGNAFFQKDMIITRTLWFSVRPCRFTTCGPVSVS